MPLFPSSLSPSNPILPSIFSIPPSLSLIPSVFSPLLFSPSPLSTAPPNPSTFFVSTPFPLSISITIINATILFSNLSPNPL
jgi:hypothetical protein